MSEQRGSGIRLTLHAAEVEHLSDLVDQFLALLRDTDPRSRAVASRLTPTLYPEDAVASAQFAEATADELRERRTTDARAVRASLAEVAGSDPAQATDVHVPAGDLDAWLRTLTALRLVIATRLGIESEDAHDPADPRFGVYDWLGYRLELLIEAADDLDGL